MTIDSISTLAGPQPMPVNGSAESQALGRDAFMKLLVAQLRNQDPMDPLDARDFVTQLSQLSGVEQLVTVGKRMEALEIATAGMANTQAATLVGRTVTANASAVSLDSTGTARGHFTLGADAASVTVRVVDGSGRVVRTIERGPTARGTSSFEWDGRDDAGARAPAGRYSFEVVAKGADGQLVQTTTRVTGVVSSVSYEQGYPELVVGDVSLMMGDILSISR